MSVGRIGAHHYRSIPPAREQLDAFKPGDEVDYHVDRTNDQGRTLPYSVRAVVVRITDRRIVIRVEREQRSRGVHPENLSKRS